MTEVIQVSNLTKRFHKQVVLRDVSLTVSSGELIGYIGPNGSGKSTTIKILCGLIPDFEGSVRVLGLDVIKDAVEVKRRIGYIPENATLYETLTPMEYLLFVGQLYQMPVAVIKKKARELLSLVGLDHAHDMRMTTFSKGMRQKVLLISGMLHNPDLIFLDEPLSGLDANSVILVKEILTQLKRGGRTIFYSSHIMDVVEKLSDRILILSQGTIIANGSFRELMEQGKGGSLEEIFTQITGQNEQVSVANSFVEVLRS